MITKLKRILAIFLLVFSLSCLADESELKDIVTSPETFAVCKTLDILSTAYVIEKGIAVEGNPIVAATMEFGKASGIGTYTPLILISIFLYNLIKQNKDVEGAKTATGIVNGLTCGAAISNILLIP